MIMTLWENILHSIITGQELRQSTTVCLIVKQKVVAPQAPIYHGLEMYINKKPIFYVAMLLLLVQTVLVALIIPMDYLVRN